MNKVASIVWQSLCKVCPRIAIRVQYKHIMGRNVNLRKPKDLNEKINYLKFHADLDEWARLADKYAVREYVIERGLGDILVPLYGKYDTPQELINDWNNLPIKFVLKSNHGCGTVKIVRDKFEIDKKALKVELEQWLKTRFGLETNEFHYMRIKPCLIVEALLEDPSVSDFSQSLVDYKMWCFDGKPYCTLVVADRDPITHNYLLDCYDANWNRIEGAMTAVHGQPPLVPKPKSYEQMLEYSHVLARGHKEVRVDLYNIDGKIFFGEMTMTSQGGYMNYFSEPFLLEMGKQFEVK